MLHTWGEGGLVDVSTLDEYDSTKVFGLSTSYYLTVTAIPISLFLLGAISMVLYSLVAFCQSHKMCCRCCQCEPRKIASKDKKIGVLPRSEELKLHYGEDDARYIAAKNRKRSSG